VAERATGLKRVGWCVVAVVLLVVSILPYLGTVAYYWLQGLPIPAWLRGVMTGREGI
jgi:hypothetical protein